MAQPGVTARRGDPVRGEILVPKLRQCSGTLGKSFFGKVSGSVRHANQYADAARASISRMDAMFSAVGNSALSHTRIGYLSHKNAFWGIVRPRTFTGAAPEPARQRSTRSPRSPPSASSFLARQTVNQSVKEGSFRSLYLLSRQGGGSKAWTGDKLS